MFYTDICKVKKKNSPSRVEPQNTSVKLPLSFPIQFEWYS